MSHSLDLAGLILGGIILKPSCLAGIDLSIRDFPEGQFRETYAAVTKIMENEQPTEIDPVLLTQQLSFDRSKEFVAKILDGAIRIDQETLRRRAIELRRCELRRRALKEVLVALQAEEQTGEIDDAAEGRIDEAWNELRQLKEETRGKARRQPVLINMADIEPRPPSWLWDKRIALGKLNLVAGDPGKAKSYLVHDISARATTGREEPGSYRRFEPCSVLMLIAEDGLSDTLRPRLDLLHADPSKIIVLDAITDRGKPKTFSLASDIPILEQVIKNKPDIKLLVIDPFTSYLGGKDANASSDVRGITDPLARFVEALNVAIVLIGHLNKSEAMQRAIHRFAHSKDWIAAARTAWLVDDDPEDSSGEGRLLITVKNNLTRRQPNLAFRVTDRGIEDYRIVEDGASADEHLQRRAEDRSVTRQACEWLKGTLADGDLLATSVQTAAEAEGYKAGTIRNAREKLGVRCIPVGSGHERKWYWSLR